MGERSPAPAFVLACRYARLGRAKVLGWLARALDAGFRGLEQFDGEQRSSRCDSVPNGACCARDPRLPAGARPASERLYSDGGQR